jgi:hypothetical protein
MSKQRVRTDECARSGALATRPTVASGGVHLTPLLTTSSLSHRVCHSLFFSAQNELPLRRYSLSRSCPAAVAVVKLLWIEIEGASTRFDHCLRQSAIELGDVFGVGKIKIRKSDLYVPTLKTGRCKRGGSELGSHNRGANENILHL